ncbi:MAG TPA: hypothetical protein ENJ77_00270 [Candidatus Moranbacteria bacterium]|nr:hypothetical protein [Candidatus Moranbacteria bacterium]
MFVFYADRLLGPWRAHRGNPVKESFAGAEPAGAAWLIDSQIYRSGKDNFSDSPGTVINRLDTLTPEEFAEVSVHKIKPPRGFARGLADLSYDESTGWLAFEAKAPAALGESCKKLAATVRKRIIAEDGADKLFRSFF